MARSELLLELFTHRSDKLTEIVARIQDFQQLRERPHVRLTPLDCRTHGPQSQHAVRSRRSFAKARAQGMWERGASIPWYLSEPSTKTWKENSRVGACWSMLVKISRSRSSAGHEVSFNLRYLLSP